MRLCIIVMEDLSGIKVVMRPGIVHRIDKDTTGVLVICKNDKAHNFVAEQLKMSTPSPGNIGPL